MKPKSQVHLSSVPEILGSYIRPLSPLPIWEGG